MKIVDYTTAKATMGDTRTAQDFGKFLGTKPHKLGLVASLYQNLTASFLCDGLMNIFYNEKKGNRFQPINSLMVEWELDINYIKKVYIGLDTTLTGVNKSDILITFSEKYYDKYDTFTFENRQQCQVIQAPTRLAADKWQYVCRLEGNDITKSLDLSTAAKGKYTRLRSNHHPELSEMGYSKFQSNTEMHRNYLTLHRASVTYSQLYATLEDVYIETAEKGDKMYYKMNKKEKDCLDSFMMARNEGLMWAKNNHDINGKCLDKDPDTGRDIPKGDGIVTQIEQYCDKSVFSRFSIRVMDEALDTMVSKAAAPTGNQFMFIVNEKLWSKMNRVLREYLKGYTLDATYFFSKSKNSYINVKGVAAGATFDTYRINGNEISFTVDRSLSHEYPDKEYGVMIDLTPDGSTNRPGVALFTLTGADMLSGNLKGMGGMDGRSSGDIATTVAGSSYNLMGYAGSAVFNPYRSYIVEENVIR